MRVIVETPVPVVACPACGAKGGIVQRNVSRPLAMLLLLATLATVVASGALYRTAGNSALLRALLNLLIPAPLFFMIAVRERGACTQCGARLQQHSWNKWRVIRHPGASEGPE